MPRTDDEVLDEGKRGFDNLLGYYESKGIARPSFLHGLEELKVVNDIPDHIKKRWEKFLDAKENEDQRVVAIEYKGISSRYDQISKKININPNGVLEGNNHEYFSIVPAVTGKIQIGDEEHIVMENIIVPLDAVFMHELGHGFYGAPAKRSGASGVKEKDVSSRRTTPFGIDLGYNNEEMQNIMGDYGLSENAVLDYLGAPLKYGYLNPENLWGGKKFYEPLKTVNRVLGILSQDNGGKSSDLFSGFLAGLPDRTSEGVSLDLNFSLMKFRTIEKVLSHAGGMVDRQNFIESMFPLDLMIKDASSRQLFIEGFLEGKRKRYKTKEKVYTDGRPKRDGQGEGQFSISFPKITKRLTYQEKDGWCTIC